MCEGYPAELHEGESSALKVLIWILNTKIQASLITTFYKLIIPLIAVRESIRITFNFFYLCCHLLQRLVASLWSLGSSWGFLIGSNCIQMIVNSLTDKIILVYRLIASVSWWIMSRGVFLIGLTSQRIWHVFVNECSLVNVSFIRRYRHGILCLVHLLLIVNKRICIL